MITPMFAVEWRRRRKLRRFERDPRRACIIAYTRASRVMGEVENMTRLGTLQTPTVEWLFEDGDEPELWDEPL